MKILVPTDFSDNANNALTFAKHMAKSQENVQITLLFAFYAVYDFAANASQIVDSIEQDAKKAMKKAVDLALSEGLKIDYQIVQGTVATAVTSKAYREDYDLIVMGTQGASGIKKALFGSNTGHVIRESQVPVLAIPAEARWENIKSVSVGVELDNSEENYYKKLLKLTQGLDFSFEFIHIKRTMDFEKELAFQGLLNYLKTNYPEIKANTKSIESNSVLHGIESYLLQNKHTFMVMFYKKKTFFEYLFNESDSVQMCYHTVVPLLIIK
ncbi:Nucleotide-binding universal stress protein, UspA family [Belliella buryatensis]|uniref:Nucleotide-binding universal stress protein, UspA family n=1 Tax=Belliella buryatensis TaxID=1500549 RepID=A0A239CFF2_9BACT|nr:universal stress protein [Belliella buryatensis]SNS18955.1 Nucleotide-binding universal stress protein, UspA family [Belliella buryatensis]